MMRSKQKHCLRVLHSILPSAMICAGVFMAMPLLAQINNGMPSKVAVTPRAMVPATAALSANPPASQKPATELLIQVERTTPVSPTTSTQNPTQTTPKPGAASEPLVPIATIEPTSAKELVSGEKSPVAAITAVVRRRPTPSKIAVNPPATPAVVEPAPADEPVIAKPVEPVKPVTELLIPVRPAATSKNTDVFIQIEAEIAQQPAIQPTAQPIHRRPTPSKIAVTAGNGNMPLYGVKTEEVEFVTAGAQERMDALTAYLAGPSKTPVAALEQQSARSNLESLELDAKSALIVDQKSREVLYSRNALEVMPIASITKLMTAMVVLDATQNMNQYITITAADVDTLKNSSSRLVVGARLTRRDLMHLTLMSSENRAAHALARNYPGGLKAFVRAMNTKATLLGMTQTRYVDPTGLSRNNQSSAHDLVWLVDAAYKYPLIRQLSTSTGYKVSVGKRRLSYINSNRLLDDSQWSIGLQKTGYIREAGYCLVMQTTVSGKELIMVFLDADEKKSRVLDAENMRNWVSS